jgi:hypothetical protein
MILQLRMGKKENLVMLEEMVCQVLQVSQDF